MVTDVHTKTETLTTRFFLCRADSLPSRLPTLTKKALLDTYLPHFPLCQLAAPLPLQFSITLFLVLVALLLGGRERSFYNAPDGVCRLALPLSFLGML